MTSIDFKFFIENDSNPFVLFSSSGKLKYLNNSAEILMGSCNPKELFKIALSYAPKSFGYNKTVLNLSFGSFEFYGINVLAALEDCSRFFSVILTSSIPGSRVAPRHLIQVNEKEYFKLIEISRRMF